MLPKPTDQAKKEAFSATVLTRNPDIAAACGVFGCVILPNYTEEIRGGDVYKSATTYAISPKAFNPALGGEFRTRKIINAYESGELWGHDPNHPFLFAMAALASLGNCRIHCQQGTPMNTQSEMDGSGVHTLAAGQRADHHRGIPESSEILRTELLPVFLAVIAVGAKFYSEATCPSDTKGLYWLHFSRTVPQFEPGRDESMVDLQAALKDAEAYPRLAVGIAAIRARCELSLWELKGKIFLFRDKPTSSQIVTHKGQRKDRRPHAFIPAVKATDETLNKVRAHMK